MNNKFFTLIISLLVSCLNYTFSQDIFSTPGTYTWTVPPCVTSITVQVWGGGGGGGGTSSKQTGTGSQYEACSEGGGGGGGGYTTQTYTVVPGQTYTIVVGAGGIGGMGTNNDATASTGGTGGTSSFTGPAVIPSPLSATGGTGGGGATITNSSGFAHQGSNGNGGVGGVGSNGSANYTGGSGSNGAHSASCTDRSGAGGGAAGPGGNGGNGQYEPCPNPSMYSTMTGGTGNGAGSGNGANGKTNQITSKDVQNGNPGNGYGGAGSGGAIHLEGWPNTWLRSNGGAGGNGAVIINYSASGAPADPIVNINPASCTADGSANVTNYMSTGTTGYTFNPSGPTISAPGTISGATPGTAYTITATGTCNSNSVSFTVPVKLTTPADPTLTSTPQSCTANSSETISNYDGSYTYTITPSGASQSSGTITGNDGSYTVTASIGGCNSSTIPFTIIVKDPAVADPIVNINPATCSADGSANVNNYMSTGTTGYTFSPSGPTISAPGTISGATPGTAYTITATGSCNSNPISFTVPQMTAISAPTVSTNPASCTADGTATVTNVVSTGTYNFTPNDPGISVSSTTGDITGLTPGTSYTVTVTDGGCNSAASSPFSIQAQLSGLPIPTVTTNSASCTADGTATLDSYVATNTYTFSPTGPSAGTGGVISGLTPGTSYTVIESSGACTSPSSAPFSIQAQLAAQPTPTITTTAPTCTADGTASVSNYATSNIYTFTPSGPTVGTGGVISNMTIGTSYTVIAASGACTSTASSPFSIQAQLPTPSTPIVTTTVSTCTAGGTATMTNYSATNTYTFTPSGPNVTTGGAISGMAAGTSYTVTATNGGCSSTASSPFSIQAQLPNQPTPLVSTNPASCTANGTATVTNYSASSTYVFTPSGPSIGTGGVISGLTFGTSYTVQSSNSGCTSTASSPFTIQAQLSLPFPVSPIVGNSSLACGITTASFSVTNDPNVTYTWSYSGTGNVTGTGSSISLTNISSGGTLTVTPSNACGNGTPQSITITIGTMQIDATSTNVSCDSAKFGTASVTTNGGTSPFIYQWSNGASTDSISNLGIGTYTVVVKDANGCTSVDSVNVGQTGNISVDVTPNPASVDEGSNIQLNAVVTPYVPGSIYTWSPTSTLSCQNCPNPIATPSETTTYTVTVTTPQGCVFQDSNVVIFKMNCGDVYIPNIFSPNKDNKNDTFNVYGRCIKKLSMKIYNRWGEKIYETTDLNKGWDGTEKGKPVQTDSYAYVVTVGLLDGTVKDFSGSVAVTK